MKMRSPEKLGASYERRGKLAALTSVGFLAVGAAKSDAIPTADAAIERSDRQEEKSPSEMVAYINSKLLKISRDIKSEPNVQFYPWVDYATKKSYKSYVLSVKSPKKAGLFDRLAITIDKKTGSPTELIYASNYSKNQRSLPKKGSISKNYSINHRTFDDYNPDVVELDVFTGAPKAFETYRVGNKRETIPGTDVLSGSIEYLDEPGVVTQRINYVFQQADYILRINK